MEVVPSTVPLCHLSPLWHSAHFPLRVPGQAGSVSGGRHGWLCSLTDTLNPRHISDLWDLGCGRLGAEEDTSEESDDPSFHYLLRPSRPHPGGSPFHSSSLRRAGQQPQHLSLPPFSSVTNKCWLVDPSTPSPRTIRTVSVSFIALSPGPGTVRGVLECYGEGRSFLHSHNQKDRHQME